MAASSRSSGPWAKMPTASFTFSRTASIQRLARAVKFSSSCHNDIHKRSISLRILRMRHFLGSIAAIAVLAFSLARVDAADVARLDAEGYIRDWIMLAP